MAHNYDCVADVVAERVARTEGRISAKRLLVVARTAGYEGSARNFRRLVADAKAEWRAMITGAGGRGCGRRATCWSSIGARSARCMCSARCWPGAGGGSCHSPTTCGRRPLSPLWPPVSRPWAGCRRRCCRTGWAASKGRRWPGVVVPTADYVRFANHYRFRPPHPSGPGRLPCPQDPRRVRPQSILGQSSHLRLPRVSLEWILAAKENLCMVGPPGRG